MSSVSLERVRRGAPQHAVLERIAEIAVARRSATRVLDIPGGSGVVAVPLALAGFDVVACDLFDEALRATATQLSGAHALADEARRNLRIDGRLRQRLFPEHSANGSPQLRVVHGDMEARLPFPDGAFDLVVSVEGIEHIGKQEHFIQQARRVLSCGGRLLLTTPNTLCFRSRMAFALTGQRTLKTFVDEYTSVQARDGERTYHGHVFLTNYFELRYLLHNNHFRIKQVIASRISPTSAFLAPVMLLPVTVATLAGAARWKRRSRDHAESPYEEICRHVLSAALLLSGTLIVEAEAV